MGSSEETIRQAHKSGIKGICDVTDLKFVQKLESLGGGVVITVDNQVGGYRGNINPKGLIEELITNCNIPVISAGGVGNKSDLDKMLSYGAEGVSVVSPFIVST